MDNKTLRLGMQHLIQVDSHIKEAFIELGMPEARMRSSGFEAFLFTIISQQLFTKVATVIMERVLCLMEEVTPEQFMKISGQSLREAGLSFRKIEYTQGLARAVLDGTFDIDGLKNLGDEEAIKAITNLRGFGRWSAEIYMMFSLGRLDVFPADDLGLLVGLQLLKGLDSRPTPKQAGRDSNWLKCVNVAS
ncbi:DNA-3-methyladenine glycosylase family protein [Vibrio vulnificus]|uniref:DNA-3-methyladenine glycosylase family protein n=1 Tax=Vibrio vulnificus TaxID=672 RepID=UPI00102891FE|nr:DNA-3-methyladenine glycosylase [Vibrio vulnificus]RZP86060.1 DNA-3-methyladenine glycosylase 2 family protein [Vibrio vulnificus]RZR39850.1 DNA-3-methyladenine glycosylase 2 family protein [Vibrio vulnificus]